MKLDQIKCIVLDLDGTLLHSMNVISKDTIDILNKFTERRIKIVICSGRHYREIQEIINKCGSINYSYVISCDGQYIYDDNGKLIWNNLFLTSKDVNFVKTLFPNEKILFFTNDCNYEIVPTLMKYLKKIMLKIFRHNNNCILYRDNQYKDDLSVEKIVLYSKMSENQANQLSKRFTVHQINDGRIELLEKNVNKYAALVKCNKYLDINKDEILYFGDDLNDLEVFNNLKHCVAMGNASEVIKSKAEFITKTNEEDGVAYFLKNYIE